MNIEDNIQRINKETRENEEDLLEIIRKQEGKRRWMIKVVVLFVIVWTAFAIKFVINTEIKAQIEKKMK